MAEGSPVGGSLHNAVLTGTPTVNGNPIETQNNKDQPNGYPSLDSGGDLVGNLGIYPDTYAGLSSEIFDLGQLFWCTDTKQLGVGDGTNTPATGLPMITLGAPTAYTLTLGTAGANNGSFTGGAAGTSVSPIQLNTGNGGAAGTGANGGAGSTISNPMIFVAGSNGGTASGTGAGGNATQISSSPIYIQPGSGGSGSSNGGSGGNASVLGRSLFFITLGSGGVGNFTNGGNAATITGSAIFNVQTSNGGAGSTASGGGTGGGGSIYQGTISHVGGTGGQGGTGTAANGGNSGRMNPLLTTQAGSGGAGGTGANATGGAGGNTLVISGNGGQGGTGGAFAAGAGGGAMVIQGNGGRGGDGSGASAGAAGGAAGSIFMHGADATTTTAGNRSGKLTLSATTTMAGGDIDTSNQTTVNGSTSGSATFSQVHQGGNFGLIIINLNNLNGTATYNFPRAYTNTPFALGPQAAAATTISTTSVTVTGAGTTGQLVLMGF